MPPKSGSRHSFTFGTRDDAARLFLSEREPYGYRELADTRRRAGGSPGTVPPAAARAGGFPGKVPPGSSRLLEPRFWPRART